MDLDFTFIEPFFVPDIFAHHLVVVQEVSTNLYRFVFTVDQISPLDGTVDHVVCCKLIVPKDLAIRNQMAASRAMGVKPFEVVRD